MNAYGEAFYFSAWGCEMHKSKDQVGCAISRSFFPGWVRCFMFLYVPLLPFRATSKGWETCLKFKGCKCFACVKPRLFSVRRSSLRIGSWQPSGDILWYWPGKHSSMATGIVSQGTAGVTGMASVERCCFVWNLPDAFGGPDRARLRNIIKKSLEPGSKSFVGSSLAFHHFNSPVWLRWSQAQGGCLLDVSGSSRGSGTSIVSRCGFEPPEPWQYDFDKSAAPQDWSWEPFVCQNRTIQDYVMIMNRLICKDIDAR